MLQSALAHKNLSAQNNQQKTSLIVRKGSVVKVCKALSHRQALCRSRSRRSESIFESNLRMHHEELGLAKRNTPCNSHMLQEPYSSCTCISHIYLGRQKLQGTVLWQHELCQVAAQALQTGISWHVTRQRSLQEPSQKCLGSWHSELKGQHPQYLHRAVVPKLQCELMSAAHVPLTTIQHTPQYKLGQVCQATLCKHCFNNAAGRPEHIDAESSNENSLAAPWPTPLHGHMCCQ